MYTDLGGESLYFGKPFQPIYDLARRRLSSSGAQINNDRILAIGDGIATQLPALFISVAAGLMVTRASSKGQIGHVMVGQVFANPRALLITAMVLLSLASVGLSPMALGSLSLVLVYLAYSLSPSRKKSHENSVSTVPAEQVHDHEVEPSSAAISHEGQNAFQRPLVIELGPGSGAAGGRLA